MPLTIELIQMAVIDRMKGRKHDMRSEFTLEDLNKARQGFKLSAVDEYLANNNKPPMSPAFIARHSLKLARINALARILNECQDLVTFKQSFNELLRLLYGRRFVYFYHGDEYNPDKLDVEAAANALSK